jgi:uncharacterized protein (TIGR03437 family)
LHLAGFVTVMILSSSSAFAANPAIAAKGVKNAASYADPELPNGAIGQGSIFNVFGSNMGPASLAYASSLPLPTNLSGTQVSVTVNGSTVQCYMIYASAGQVAAILPSTTPAGTGTIAVSYNGAASATAPIKVVASSFGIFTINQQGGGQAVVQDANYKFNSATFAFQPGETVVLWGTGLGPISGSDANAPPSGNLPGIKVTVYVGGVAAPVTYAGRSGYSGDDQVAFTIPNGVSGCNVPVGVYVSAANGSNTVVSNFTTIAVGSDTTCSSPGLTPSFLQTLASGGNVRIGAVVLARSTIVSPLIPTPITQDSGTGGFALRSSSTYAQGLDLNYGACAIEPSVVPQTVTLTQLDAGPVINVSGPNGAKTLAQLKGTVGSYDSTLGGGFALPGQTPPPLYLAPGTYSVDNGAGGKDVGAFKFNLTVPPPLTWTNFPSNNIISRSSPLTVNWTGGDPNSDVYLSGSSGVSTAAEVTFICRARVSDGSITVPVSILQASILIALLVTRSPHPKLKPTLEFAAGQGQPVLLAGGLQPVDRNRAPVFRGGETDRRAPRATGSILAIEDGLATIDLGSLDGLSQDSELPVFRDKHLIDRLQVRTVFRDHARGRLVEGHTAQVKDLVRVDDAAHLDALMEQIDALYNRGDADAAYQMAEQNSRWAETANVPPARQSAWWNQLGVLRMLRGDYQAAEAPLTRSGDTPHDSGLEYARRMNNLGVLAELRGQRTEARAQYSAALQAFAQIPEAPEQERHAVEANLARIRGAH